MHQRFAKSSQTWQNSVELPVKNATEVRATLKLTHLAAGNPGIYEFRSTDADIADFYTAAAEAMKWAISAGARKLELDEEAGVLLIEIPSP